MPRIRYLKPDFFLDEDLAELPIHTRVTFEGLWCHADKAGRLLDKPKYLKAVIWAYDKVEIEKDLQLLAKPKKSGRPFILRYEVNGVKLIQILTWEKHQRPHPTEKASELPEVPKDLLQKTLTVNEPLNKRSLNVKKRLNKRSLTNGEGEGEGEGNGERNGDRKGESEERGKPVFSPSL